MQVYVVCSSVNPEPVIFQPLARLHPGADLDLGAFFLKPSPSPSPSFEPSPLAGLGIHSTSSLPSSENTPSLIDHLIDTATWWYSLFWTQPRYLPTLTPTATCCYLLLSTARLLLRCRQRTARRSFAASSSKPRIIFFLARLFLPASSTHLAPAFVIHPPIQRDPWPPS